jgi:hypothetical protein
MWLTNDGADKLASPLTVAGAFVHDRLKCSGNLIPFFLLAVDDTRLPLCDLKSNHVNRYIAKSSSLPPQR